MKKLEANGMNVFLWLGSCAIIIIGVFLGVLSNDILGAIAVCLGVGSITYFIGEHVPIWNAYFGGGVLATSFFASAMTEYGWLPEATITTVKSFIGSWGFLNLFIVALVVGSILAVDRELLLKSITRFIPCILGGVVGAAVLGSAVGLFFGKSPSDIVSYYALPIMAAGSGSGALPLGEMFASITGGSYEEYITVSMAMLSIANILAIIVAAMLGKFLANKPLLCGDGKLMKDQANETETKEILPPTLEDLANSLVVLFAVYMLATIIASKILPTIMGVSIHLFAYSVLITVALKVFNVIPENIVSALVYTQKYFVKATVVIVMFSCGLAYVDFNTFVSCVTNPVDLLLCLAVVVGSVIGAGAVGSLVGFYPYEAAVTAGLCMANSGGTGDVAVLSACDRMNLMPYAQISSRIGNAIILILGSFMFSIMF